MIAAPSCAAPHNQAGPSTNVDDCFSFHPRASNPELWRSSVPLIVRIRCARHKGLILTWLAIHWLIVAHAASGLRAFGMREIAQEAGVGRNELAGPNGHIQRLVALGLLSIVGYQPVAGLREPRPIYQIDLAELERQSLEIAPALLRERHLAPPPRPAPDPRQLSLFADQPPLPGTTTPAAGPGTPVSRPAQALNEASMPVIERGGGPIAFVLPGNGTVLHQNGLAVPGSGTVIAPERVLLPESGTGLPASGTATHQNGLVTHQNGTTMPASGVVLARKRDVEGEKEGEKEGASEITRAHDFHQFTASVAQVVIETLRSQGLIGVQALPPITQPPVPPAAPAGQPALPNTLLALWQGDQATLSQRDRHQIELLAAEYDAKTDGAGAYWVGRAILLADACLSERGRPLSLAYVRGMLRRWEREASWGSDLADEPAPSAERRPEPTPRPAEATQPPAPSAAVPTPPASHPAITAYTSAFGRAPNAVQSAQIAATVTDLELWKRVLTDWQANGWKEAAVAKMLDRYRKDVGLAAPAEQERPPSITGIYHHPGLNPDQRTLWIRRFHAATSPAEKRAVLTRLAGEHPWEGLRAEG